MNCKKKLWKVKWRDCQIKNAIKNKEISTSLKLFIWILISLLFYNEIISELFSCEDKDPRLRLRTLSFKFYNCFVKGRYSSKTVCCCGTKLQRKGLRKYLQIYRHLLSKCLKNAVKYFSDTKQNHGCWKICKVRSIFSCVAGTYYFQCQVSWGSENEWHFLSETLL